MSAADGPILTSTLGHEIAAHAGFVMAGHVAAELHVLHPLEVPDQLLRFAGLDHDGVPVAVARSVAGLVMALPTVVIVVTAMVCIVAAMVTAVAAIAGLHHLGHLRAVRLSAPPAGRW